MPETLWTELPRFLTDEFRDSLKHTSFYGHLAVLRVIAVETTQALDGQTKNHDSSSVSINRPSWDCFVTNTSRGTVGHIKVHAIEFRWPE